MTRKFSFPVKSEEHHGMLSLFNCRLLKHTFVPKGEEVQCRLEKHL